ncbi:MAG: sigma-54-dependent Fis family transcriptional regulator [Spirochaetes bacterium]|nr:sigma-54-dependent Fis family transcriptional regulator [Spirochaetota bacterium]
MKRKILVADDEIGVRELFKELLKDDYKVSFATNGEEAIDMIEKDLPEVVLLDIRMPKKDGLEVLQEVKDRDISIIIIIITADRDLNSAIKAMKLGAYDYVVKPFENDKILKIIQNAFEKSDLEKTVKTLKKEITKQYSFKNIIGQGKNMQKVYEVINKVINNDSTVLLTGESGTGKEIVARSIHYNGHRKEGPFVAVDCASIPETLIESELFGHEKGSYTGALKRKIGKFEMAHRGTIFLDEIGNLKMDIQAKLLRVLQEREFSRVGGNEKIQVDVRIIAATNANLEGLINKGVFREDLFYRLNVVPFKLPPLRERKEDIPLLIQHFLRIFNKEFNKNITLSPKVIDYFIKYPWPGNVRELENNIQRIVVTADHNVIKLDDMPDSIKRMGEKKSDGIKAGMKLDEAEKYLITETLVANNFNMSKTSKILGVTRKTLHNKIARYKIKTRPKTSKG